jgi:quercetin dioxygenase-like cupin family protein
LATSFLFPDPILNLPEADIPLPGLKAYLSQAEDHQIIFMSFSQDVNLPEHSHAGQWGVVLQGQIDLTIAGHPQTFLRGDQYFIPAGVSHY